MGANIWLGLETTYEWETGSTLLSNGYNNLVASSSSDGSCFYWRTSDGKWEDDCSGNRRVICEKSGKNCEMFINILFSLYDNIP